MTEKNLQQLSQALEICDEFYGSGRFPFASLPAKKVLEDENIFVMSQTRANNQDIRPLKIIILNLMPEKQRTELDLYRLLSNTPLQVNITFIQMVLDILHLFHQMKL